MAKNIGAISLHRQIQEHWIWKDSDKLKWWLDILLTVNYEDKKVKLGNEVYLCKRGESLLSIQSWAERWRTTKDTARNFLILLEKDAMVSRVSIGKSTRLTVCNYDTYQVGLRVKTTDVTHEQYPTNKEVSKDTNISARKEVFKNDIRAFQNKYPKEMLNGFFTYWAELNKSKTQMRFEKQPTWELNLRLASWSKNSLKKTDFKNHKNYSTDHSNVSN